MKASDHAGVLPVLAESPRRQVVLSGLWVVLFVLLLTAAAVRIGAEVQPTWWLPVALFLGMAAADSGQAWCIGLRIPGGAPIYRVSDRACYCPSGCTTSTLTTF
jgi:hypothetical protein